MRTSMIVGLPGETEEDFELLKEFVKEQRFERLGVFQYSDEEGTAAAYEYENKVPKKTIERRWREVMAIKKRLPRAQPARGPARSRSWWRARARGVRAPAVGRHEGQAPEIDGVTLGERWGKRVPGDCTAPEVTRRRTSAAASSPAIRLRGALAVSQRYGAVLPQSSQTDHQASAEDRARMLAHDHAAELRPGRRAAPCAAFRACPCEPRRGALAALPEHAVARALPPAAQDLAGDPVHRRRGGTTRARSTGVGVPRASRSDTSASPTPSSVIAASTSRPGFARNVSAAARTAF